MNVKTLRVPREALDNLGVFQIHSIRWEDDAHTKGKEWNTTIVCKDIKAVWEWLTSELSDLRVEIRAINHVGHACAVIPFPPDPVEVAEPAQEGGEA